MPEAASAIPAAAQDPRMSFLFIRAIPSLQVTGISDTWRLGTPRRSFRIIPPADPGMARPKVPGATVERQALPAETPQRRALPVFNQLGMIADRDGSAARLQVLLGVVA
jgi:hypothetical protein